MGDTGRRGAIRKLIVQQWVGVVLLRYEIKK